MTRKRGCLIAAVAGGLVLVCLLLLLTARRERRPHISHQRPYRWDQYPRPNLHVEMKPWIDVVAEVNAAMSEASQGEITEAVIFDTTPTRIVKVNCTPELEAYADVFIAAYREHETEMNRRGAHGFEGAPCTGDVLQEDHSICCSIRMLAGADGLGYAEMEDALYLGRMPRAMECRPYVVTEALVERMKQDRINGKLHPAAEPIASALA
ncbi:MAG: hypothetical protein ACYS9X_22505, partial [Planctomycetota bacterium]